MAEVIPSNHWNHGAGKGSDPRPVNPKVFKENLSQIKFDGKHSGKVKKIKASKTTYTY